LEKHRAQLTVQVTKGTPLAPAGRGDEVRSLPQIRRFNRSTEVVAPQISSPIRQQQEAKRDLRRARYQHAHDLKARGLSLRAIGRALNATRRTVKRLLESDRFPEHARRGAKLKPFDDYLRQRWTAGVRNARQLYAEIHARGYAGSYLEVTRWVQPWRAEAPLASPSVPAVSLVPTPVTVTETRSPRQVSYWFVLSPDRLTAEQTDQLQQLLTTQPALAALYGFAQAFRALLLTSAGLAAPFALSHSVEALHTWIDAVSHSNQPELNGFAQGLLRDLHAVTAAITTPHSSGQVEGQVNRLKLIKRMMYGRGNLDLLRQRVMFSLA
jgi:transposase